LTYPHRPQTTY